MSAIGLVVYLAMTFLMVIGFCLGFVVGKYQGQRK